MPLNFIVGVDPGKHTGYGILDKSLKYWESGVKDFHSIQKMLDSIFPNKDEVKIFVELPPQFTYSRNRGRDDKAQFGDFQAMAIGGNRREAELLKGALENLGFDVEHVPPVRQQKWDAELFQAATGSYKRTNEHERDAVRLAMHYATKRIRR